MKKCTKCEIEKELIEFGKDLRLKSGFKSVCKTCLYNITKEWRKNNPEKPKQHLKAYYESHKDKWVERRKSENPIKKENRDEYFKDWYRKNRDRVLSDRRKNYKEKQTEEIKAYNQKYYNENKDRIKENSYKNYLNLSEDKKKKRVEQVRNWRANNRHKSNAWSAVGNALIRGDLIKPVICEKCNCKDILHAHHEDYNKPLEIVWVCHSCHMKIHKEKRRIII